MSVDLPLLEDRVDYSIHGISEESEIAFLDSLLYFVGVHHREFFRTVPHAGVQIRIPVQVVQLSDSIAVIPIVACHGTNQLLSSQTGDHVLEPQARMSSIRLVIEALRQFVLMTHEPTHGSNFRHILLGDWPHSSKSLTSVALNTLPDGGFATDWLEYVFRL